MKMVKGPVCELAIDDAGTGKKTPLILVHSLGGNMSHWDDIARALRTDRRVIRYDIRGHGRSTPPTNHDFTIEGYAEDIETVASALGLNRFILIGHSVSGGAAYVYAAQNPGRVLSYILFDPIVDGAAHSNEIREFAKQLSTDRYREILPSFWSQLTGPKLDIRNRLLADVSATPQESVARSFQSFLEFKARPYAGKFTGPSLSVVTDSNDGPHSLHNLPPGFPHTIVHETGHWIHLEKPDEVQSILHEFLKHAGQ